MRFKVDQNLPVQIADALRRVGHFADTVYEEDLAGTSDSHLSAIFKTDNRALVTLDLGFADIRTYPPARFMGLIVLRPRTQDKPTVLRVFERVLPLLEQEPLVGKLWIVNEWRVRIRS